MLNLHLLNNFFHVKFDILHFYDEGSQKVLRRMLIVIIKTSSVVLVVYVIMVFF